MVQRVTFKGEDYMCYGLHWYIMASWHWHYILQHILMPHMAYVYDGVDVTMIMLMFYFVKFMLRSKWQMIHNDDT